MSGGCCRINRSSVERIRLFEDPPFLFTGLLEEYIDNDVEWKDLSMTYIESRARAYDNENGPEIGSLFFCREITDTQTHYKWFALLATDKKTFEMMCDPVENLKGSDLGFIYEYYMNIHRSQDDFRYARPELKAYFGTSLSAESADDGGALSVTTEFVDSDPTPGRIVYFWGPPRVSDQTIKL